MVSKGTDLDKVLGRIEDLSEIIQKSTASDEEIQKINAAMQSLQLSINDIVDKKVTVAINNQQKVCQVHFDAILEKIEEAVEKIDEYRKDIAKEKSAINDLAIAAVKNSLNQSIEDLKESFQEYKGAQQEKKDEVEENKRTWKSMIWGGIFTALFSVAATVVLLLILWLVDHFFELGLVTYLNAS